MSIGRWARGLAGIAFFGTIVGGTQACIEAEGELYITNVLQPTDPSTTDACGEIGTAIVGVNAGLVTNSIGTETVVDRSEIPAYALLCVQNHMRSRSDNGVETSNVILYQYDVTLSSGGGTRTQAVSGSVAASDSNGVSGFDGSHTSMPTELMTGSEVADAAAGASGFSAVEVVATVKYYGRTTGGLEVETPDFFVPIRVYAISEPCVCDGDPATEYVCRVDDPGCM
jgi:hypothetical protein